MKLAFDVTAAGRTVKFECRARNARIAGGAASICLSDFLRLAHGGGSCLFDTMPEAVRIKAYPQGGLIRVDVAGVSFSESRHEIEGTLWLLG